MRLGSIPVAIALLSLALAPAALAVPELDDAGELPGSAQVLTNQVVGSISGELASGEDVDLYRICLAGGGSFSATTVGGTEVDTELYLFDGRGLGVYANGDAGPTKQSLLPAGDPLTPSAPGEYLLGISAYDRNPQSASGEIFNNVAFLVGASGRGAGQPLEGWAGNTRSLGPYEIALTGVRSCETTPPSVDLRSPRDGDKVPLGARVTVDFSCADEGGSGLESCVGSVPDGGELDTSVLGPQVVTVTARDGAGNETVALATVEVEDRGAPRIEIRSPVDGTVLSLGEEALANYECRDEPNGSGVASCSGDVPDGSALDTSTVGLRSLTVTASDGAGNSSSATSDYEVVLVSDFRGFAWPARDFPAVGRWVAGLPLPIRFSLRGDQARDPVADGYPQVARVECGAGELPSSGERARGELVRQLHHRSRHGRYLFWWKTEPAWAGSCRQFLLKLDRGPVERAEFRFRRGGWPFYPGWGW